MSTRAAAWLVGSLVVGASAPAALLFVIGESLAAIKLALYILLLPGFILFVALTVTTVRRPSWYRNLRDVAGVMALVGSILVLAPVLLYAPWAPPRFPLGEMPFGLPILMKLGAPLVAVGSIVLSSLEVIEAWRRGDWSRALFGLFLLAIIGLVIVRVVSGQ